MTLFRIVFLVLAIAAVSGTAYVSYYGYGRQSRDVTPSLRVGSGGASGMNALVK